MAVESLEDLKAANAALEEKKLATPQVVEDDPKDKAVEDETVETKGDADPDEEEAGETETQAFMLTDEEKPADEKKFTDSDIGAAKKKLRAKLEVKDSEIEKLKAENEQLRSSPSATGEKARPKREDFEESEDPQEAYEDALMDWKLSKNNANNRQQSVNAEQERIETQRQTEVSQSVDQHYERAVVLAEKSNISAELYQSADGVVRKTVESIFPKNGDTITDSLIANLGEGSEKVMYNLGVNKKRLDHFKQLLKSDPGGIKAAMYLGKLNAELNAPSKKRTKAPAPASTANGDSPISNDDDFVKTKKSYDKANESGDKQAAFNIRMAARRQGAPTNTW